MNIEQNAYDCVIKQRYEEASVLYEQLLKEKPNSKVHYNLGIMYRRLGDAMAAIRHFETAITLDKWMVSAYFMFALTCQEIGDYQRAIKLYGFAITKLRNHPYIEYNQMGLMLTVRKQDILTNRAMCRFQVKNLNFAKLDLKEAKELDPAVPQSLRLLVLEELALSKSVAVFAPQNLVMPNAKKFDQINNEKQRNMSEPNIKEPMESRRRNKSVADIRLPTIPLAEAEQKEEISMPEISTRPIRSDSLVKKTSPQLNLAKHRSFVELILEDLDLNLGQAANEGQSFEEFERKFDMNKYTQSHQRNSTARPAQKQPEKLQDLLELMDVTEPWLMQTAAY